MAAKSGKTAKAKTVVTDPANTSAPAAGEYAEVSATGAGQPAPHAETESAPPATSTVRTEVVPPMGAAAPTHIRVKARAEAGFRRAGRHWPQAETCLPLSELALEHIEALVAEPELVVAFSVESAEAGA